MLSGIKERVARQAVRDEVDALADGDPARQRNDRRLVRR
jgi:hypothetical protein